MFMIKKPVAAFMPLFALALTLTGLAPSISIAAPVFTVQLGSFEKEKDAKAHWEELQDKFPGLFEPLTYAPAEVQLPPDNFVYHRTQAGPIATREEAEAICAKVAAASFECYVAETAMFSANGGSEPQEESLLAELGDAEPDTRSQPAESVASQPREESLGLMELEEIEPAFPPLAKQAPLPPVATTAPVPVPTPAPVSAPAQPVVAAQDEPLSGLPPLAPAPAVSPAPAFLAPSAASAPFEQGQSRFATPGNAVPIPAAPAFAPSALPVDVAAVPLAESTSPHAQVHVGEAIPVPLSGGIPGGLSDSPGAQTYRLRPADFNRPENLWAEISHFQSQESALGYWNILRERDLGIQRAVRLRVTRPLRQRGTEKLSLRVGPFASSLDIRRLCAQTRPERLQCRAVRDLGASVTPSRRRNDLLATRQRERARMEASRRQPPVLRAPSPVAAAPRKDYWVMLGAYGSPAEAQADWNRMQNANNAILGGLEEQVSTQGGGRFGYRLRTGPFSLMTEALNTCNRLKQVGRRCVVTSGR